MDAVSTSPGSNATGLSSTGPALTPPRRALSGRLVVLAMLGFGGLTTLTNYLYWEAHTRPFRPLTQALGEAFPGSLPKVEGGRFKGGPSTLRIATRVPFNPQVDLPAADERLRAMLPLIVTHAKLTEFEQVEIHEIFFAPQKQAISQTWRLTPAEVQQPGDSFQTTGDTAAVNPPTSTKANQTAGANPESDQQR